jgi:hypothetical protein
VGVVVAVALVAAVAVVAAAAVAAAVVQVPLLTSPPTTRTVTWNKKLRSSELVSLVRLPVQQQ